MASLVFSLLLLASTGLAFAAPPAKLAPNRTFTFRISGEPETLDWNKAHTTIETHVLMNLMEGLVAFDKDLKVVPSLAKSWDVSKDGRTYTFKLRPGVLWSDGNPLRAKDFVYSWKRLLSPLTAASYAYLLFDVVGAEFYNRGALKDFSQVGVKALDDQTLQVKLTRPVAHWIQLPTFWVTFPVREDMVDKHGTGWDKPGRMVTLGPYMLAAYDIDSRVVLKANPKYWGQRGNVEEVVALIVKDDSTALSLYETGRLDFLTDLATLDIKRLKSSPDLRTFPYLKTGYLGFSTNTYPIANPKFRRAIAHAIDKRRIPEILHGGQEPAGSFVPPGMMASSRTMGLKFDPALARQELKAAGVDPRKALNLEILLPNWDKAMTLAQFIQGELKKNLGIEAVLQPFDHKTFRSHLDLKTFPMFEGSWAADFPDPDNFLSIFLSNSGNNRFAWKNEAFDETVLAARDSLEPRAREAAYLDAQRTLIEKEAVIIPLYYEPNIGLVKPRVKGLELNRLNYLFLRSVQLTSN